MHVSHIITVCSKIIEKISEVTLLQYTIIPKHQANFEGENAKLNCTIPPPVTWKKKGGKITHDVVIQDNILYFAKLQIHHSGTYLCHATLHGLNFKAWATLLVGGKSQTYILCSLVMTSSIITHNFHRML